MAETWPAQGLKQRWKQSIGAGYAGISVADGRVYTMDRLKEPDEVERVVCLDATTGQPLWTHQYPVEYGDLPYGSGPRAQPTFHQGRLYTLGSLGQACCLDAASGKLLWQVDAVRDLGGRIPEWGFAASPVVWRDRVILHVGARPDGCFIALALDTGKPLWRSGSDPAGYATPIVVDPPSGMPLLVGWTPEHIAGIDLQTGHVHWEVPYQVTYGVSIATPIYHQRLVFVAGYWEGSKAIRLGTKVDEATLAWEDEKGLRGLMSQPLYRNGYAYLLDKQYGLICFELATGAKRWDDGNRMTPRGRNPQASLVWLGESDRAVILNADGELILARLTPEGYDEQSRTKIIGPTWAHPAYSGARVYARNDEELVCVELPVAAP